MKNQKGFSLIELLVVVIIIAIIAAIAIPSLLASRRAANEGSAISSLRIYHSAQATWYATTGLTNAYTDSAGLGAAFLVDGTLGVAAPTKSGYTFTVTQAGTGATATYCGMAQPTVRTGTTATGTREFGIGSANGGQIVVFGPTVAAASITCASGALGGTSSLL
ncbi:MAG: prepilin-type N-terminal cleavage/methylation domain-containing protein [bacterium]|nr:prepilin-type N-terminal cleavage/methylation domain-containing protein [bacterium]